MAPVVTSAVFGVAFFVVVTLEVVVAGFVVTTRFVVVALVELCATVGETLSTACSEATSRVSAPVNRAWA